MGLILVEYKGPYDFTADMSFLGNVDDWVLGVDWFKVLSSCILNKNFKRGFVGSRYSSDDSIARSTYNFRIYKNDTTCRITSSWKWVGHRIPDNFEGISIFADGHRA
ncbi:hypothetical protein A7318_15805 [Pseudomonas lurida]|nr:hypothetical protein A7318_15805 [Pseudomonas lurida]